MQQALLKADKNKAADLISNNNFKVRLGSAVLGFKKVAYSSGNDLVKKALEFRKSLGKATGQAQNAGSGSNVAVFEYVNLQGKTSYMVKMADEAGHAEAKIAAKLDELGIPPENVKRIYTELDSCAACTEKIIEYVENGAKGFYSFEYNTKGKSLWQGKLRDFYDYISGTKK